MSRMKPVKMKNKYLLVMLYLITTGTSIAQKQLIWNIGDADNNSSEFALSDGDYEKFLEHDFGWEDQFFLIGFSNEKKEFPFVLPGAYDYWGGTSGLAGIRPHEINILFGITDMPKNNSYELILDILDCNTETPPLLKVSVNGMSWKFQLDSGQNDNALK